MSEPIEKFCRLLAKYPDEERREIAFDACLALGCEFTRTDTPYSPDTPAGELHIFPGRHEMQAKLQLLAEKHGVREEFLIPGLYHHLIDHFRRVAETNHESIDFHLRMLSKLEDELRKPQVERKDRQTDQQISTLIESMKRILAGKPAHAEMSKRIAERLEKEWAEEFTHEYWEAHSFKKLRGG